MRLMLKTHRPRNGLKKMVERSEMGPDSATCAAQCTPSGDASSVKL